MAYLKKTARTIDGKRRYTYTIRFTDGVRKRDIRLNSNYRESDAVQLCDLVGELVKARKYDSCLSRRSEALLSSLPQEFLDRLVDFGLLNLRDKLTISKLLELFLKSAKDRALKPKSIKKICDTIKKIELVFNTDQFVDRLTREDSDVFYKSLISSGLSRASVNCHVGYIKSIFNWAVKNDFLDRNPFSNLVAGNKENREREYFVTREAYSKLLESAPDQTWRTIIALARIGGLRTPSEPAALTWEDVDWSRHRLRIHSIKTERHAGHSERVIPLWRELEIELERQFEIAEPGGSPFILPIQKIGSTKFSYYLRKIIFQAGLIPWPKPFQNLRASRSTEIFSDSTIPDFVAEYWLGHSKRVAQKHYLQITDLFYEQQIAQQLPQNLPPKQEILSDFKRF